jgi:hypothetical protein
MRLHFPQPRHGWRAFVGEIAIIVVGVLIALAAQQAMDKWRWAQDVERTRTDLDDEILYNVALSAERIAVNSCLKRRLSELGMAVAASDGRWTPISASGMGKSILNPAIPLVYRAPNRVFTTDVWEQAKANGILNHMNPVDVQSYSSTYAQIAHLREHNAEEQRLMPALSFLGFAGPIDPSSRERAITTIASLDLHNNWMLIIGQQVADVAGLSTRRLSADALSETKEAFDQQRKVRGACVDPEAGMKMLAPLSPK